jgi:hypothetical protein
MKLFRNRVWADLAPYFVILSIMTLSCSQAFANFGSLPQFDIDSSGNAVAVWEDIDNNQNYSINAASKSSGGSWDTPGGISTPGHYPAIPYVVIDSSGNAFAVWSESDPLTTNTVLYGAIHPFGGSWSSPIQISPSDQSSLNDYTLKLNGSTNVVLMWSAYDSTYSNLNINSATATIGSGWGSVVQVSN